MEDVPAWEHQGRLPVVPMTDRELEEIRQRIRQRLKRLLVDMSDERAAGLAADLRQWGYHADADRLEAIRRAADATHATP